MKLRVRGNSIRLRLTKGEVAHVGAGGRVEEVLEFGLEPSQRLTYALEVSDDVEELSARYQAGRITLTLPKRVAERWASTESVTLDAEQTVAEGIALKLMVEKDFTCLAEHRGADDADTFPHPLEGALHC